MVGHRAAEKGLELTCFVRPGVPAAVVGDPERLRQILFNLASNAIKFTERGEVRIAAELVAAGDLPTIRLSVADTGIGIPADRLAQLFAPFMQVDASTTRKLRRDRAGPGHQPAARGADGRRDGRRQRARPGIDLLDRGAVPAGRRRRAAAAVPAGGAVGPPHPGGRRRRHEPGAAVGAAVGLGLRHRHDR